MAQWKAYCRCGVLHSGSSTKCQNCEILGTLRTLSVESRATRQDVQGMKEDVQGMKEQFHKLYTFGSRHFEHYAKYARVVESSTGVSGGVSVTDGTKFGVVTNLHAIFDGNCPGCKTDMTTHYNPFCRQCGNPKCPLLTHRGPYTSLSLSDRSTCTLCGAKTPDPSKLCIVHPGGLCPVDTSSCVSPLCGACSCAPTQPFHHGSLVSLLKVDDAKPTEMWFCRYGHEDLIFINTGKVAAWDFLDIGTIATGKRGGRVCMIGNSKAEHVCVEGRITGHHPIETTFDQAVYWTNAQTTISGNSGNALYNDEDGLMGIHAGSKKGVGFFIPARYVQMFFYSTTLTKVTVWHRQWIVMHTLQSKTLNLSVSISCHSSVQTGCWGFPTEYIQNDMKWRRLGRVKNARQFYTTTSIPSENCFSPT